ncbi:MAG: TlpA disulfide reductase family protein [Bacteroidota bacterium]
MNRLAAVLLLLPQAVLAFTPQPAVIKIDDLVKRINTFSDTTFIVNFWATWCPPCVEELPEIDAFGLKHEGSKTKVLLVSINYKEDYHSKLIPFITEKNVKSEVVLLDERDFDHFPGQVDKTWNGDLPSTLFLNNSKGYRKMFRKKIDCALLSQQASHIHALPAIPKPNIIKVKDLTARVNKSSDTIYIVNFWATWCVPCVQELPDFEKIGQEYDSAKVKVILVSMDFKEDYDSKLIPFLIAKDIRSEVVLLDETNANYFIPLIDDRWSGALPASLILRNDKQVKDFYGKKLSYELLKEKIDTLLN